MQGKPKKTDWFYYDETGEKQGPFTQRQLKNLAEQGIITPKTQVENSEGQSSLARKIKGLKFPSLTSDASEPGGESSVIAPVSKKTTWFYYNKNGEKRGPFTNRQLKNLAKGGVITPETRIENVEGQSCLAKNAVNLHFASPKSDEHTAAGGVENETIGQVIHEALYRQAEKEGVIGKTREKFALPKIKIISGVVAVALLLGITSLVFSGFQRTPSGIIYLEGIVTLDGKPIDGVNVVLHPRDREGTSAGGMTDARGRFRVTTHPAPVGSGARAGEYDVTFSKMEVVEMAMVAGRPVPASDETVPEHIIRASEAFDARTHVIPPRYGRPKTSGLEPITVAPNGRNRFTFTLTSVGETP